MGIASFLYRRRVCMEDTDYYIGIDVGTESVRGGLFTADGKLSNYSSKEIQTWPNPDVMEGSYEQSTSDIWKAISTVVKVFRGGCTAITLGGINVTHVNCDQIWQCAILHSTLVCSYF